VSAGKWQKFNLVWGMASVASDMGWLWTGWICPAPVQMSGMLSGRRTVVILCGLLQSLVVFSLTSCFFVNSHLDHWFLRARLLRLCCTAVSPPIFLQLRKGPLWRGAEFLQSYALCSSDQCRTVKLRLPAVRELFWGKLGRGDGVWRGIGNQEVGTMKSMHWKCEM